MVSTESHTYEGENFTKLLQWIEWTHGLHMESWYWQGCMVQLKTHGIDNAHGIDLDSFYRIATPESHTYEGGILLSYCSELSVLL